MGQVGWEMSKFNNYKNSFNYGELSPLWMGRIESEEYVGGCQTAYNFIIRAFGGGSFRPGSRFTFNMSAMTGGPGLLPFIASKSQGYTISIDPTQGAASGNKLVRINTAAGVACTVDETPFLSLDGTFYVLPTTNIDPALFCFSQVADVMIITHLSGRYPTMLLRRTADTTFRVDAFVAPAVNPYIGSTNISNVLRTPYRDVNIGTLTLTPSAVTGAINITASAAFWDAGHKGASFKITHAGVTGSVRITGITSNLVATGTVTKNFGATTASTNWEEGAWSDYRGWPRTVCIFEQSAFFGGNTSEPDTLWKSLTGNIYHMMARKFEQDSAGDVSGLNYFGALVVTDPSSLPLAANQVNNISWLVSTGVLNIGTLGEEYVGQAGDQQDVLGGKSASIKSQTAYGAIPCKAIHVEDHAFFIQADGRRLRTFSFSQQNGSNLSIDLSRHADHMSRKGGMEYGFKDMCYQKSRGVVWLLNNNGHIVSCTFNQDAKVLAWAHHEIAGAEEITGMCCVPNSDGISDNLFIMVKRTINSATKYYIEQIPMDYDNSALAELPTVEEDIPMFADCSIRILITNPAGDDTLTGLSHLEGEDVVVTKDGVLLGTFTVASNEIDLGQTYPLGTSFIVGLAYTGELTPTNIVAGGDFGSAKGAISRVDKATILFYKSYSAKVAEVNIADGLMENINFGSDIFSGEKVVNLTANPDISQAVRILVEDPYPCNVLAIAARGVAND